MAIPPMSDGGSFEGGAPASAPAAGSEPPTGDPMALMGSGASAPAPGVDPMAGMDPTALMGGAPPAGGSGAAPGGDPMAALSGSGGDPLAPLMGGTQLPGDPMTNMFGQTTQNSSIDAIQKIQTNMDATADFQNATRRALADGTAKINVDSKCWDILNQVISALAR